MTTSRDIRTWMSQFQKAYFLSYDVCMFYSVFEVHGVFQIRFQFTHIRTSRQLCRSYHIFPTISNIRLHLENLLYEAYLLLVDPCVKPILKDLSFQNKPDPGVKHKNVCFSPQVTVHTYDPTGAPCFIRSLVKFPSPDTASNLKHNFRYIRKAFKPPFDPRQ